MQIREPKNLQTPKEKISFSELKIWNECAYKHKLVYIDKLPGFKGNEYTAFGTAIHSVCERLVFDSEINKEEHFRKSFLNELKELRDIGVELNPKMIREMKSQGEFLCKDILPSLKDYFPEYEVVSVEEELYEKFEDTGTNYKGFIDLVLKTPDGKYHIIDWKTCSWGWDMKKKSERMTTYQLTYYKNFYSKKHNIDLGNIETHFALLKRTAKKNNVELFRVTSGNRKINNALELLKKSLSNINSKKFIKNRLSCSRCEFKGTQHCTS